MPHARRILTSAVAAAAVLGFAAPAYAATVTTLPCVVSVNSASLKNMPIGGSGFTPGALVTVRYVSTQNPTPTYLTSATADPSGNIAVATYPATFNKFDTQQQSFTLVATDGTNPAIAATASFQQVRLGYRTNPATGKPTRNALHTVRGFPPGKKTYLHFRFGGKTKRNVLLGTTSSPCGVVSKRMRLLPAQSHPGTWTVYVDQEKAYHKGTPAQLKYKFVISRTFG
jgi:hypothetical protein